MQLTPPLTPITTIGMVTADRPAAVRRSLQSFADHCNTHAHRPRFIVVDSSRQPQNRRDNQSAVAAIAAGSGHDMRYVGPVEAALFREALAAQAAVDVELELGTAGQNRNLLLLLTAGEHLLLVDDDVVAETWGLPDRHDGVIVAGHDDLRHMAFFENRQSALAAASAEALDLLNAHNAMLGRSLPELVEASQPPADLSAICSHLLGRLQDGRDQQVRVSFSGLAGDSGTYCPYRLLLAPGLFRRNCLAEPTTYKLAMTSREVLRIARANIVTHDSNCMAYCMGVSNRSLVPPFLPAGGNEDGVFGLLLAASVPGALFAHLPVGIHHDSSRSAEYFGPPMLSAMESRLAELVIALVRRLVVSLRSEAPDERLKAVGTALVNLSGLPGTALRELVTEITHETRERDLLTAEREADTPDCPVHWRDGFTQYRKVWLRSAERPELVLPVEFRGRGSLAEGYRALGRALNQLGELIAVWSVLWEGARVIRIAESSERR